MNTKKEIEAIRLSESGERLYVFAIANKPPDISIFPKVRYLTTEEFPFYENDQILTKDSLFGQVYPWRVLAQINLCKIYTLFKKIQLWSQTKYWFGELTWQPVIAERIWEGRISLDGQIAVNSEWSDTYYLNPSQKYLKARVDNWIKAKLRFSKINKVAFGWEDYKIAGSLQAWRQQCRKDGYEITYLASLDT